MKAVFMGENKEVDVCGTQVIFLTFHTYKAFAPGLLARFNR